MEKTNTAQKSHINAWRRLAATAAGVMLFALSISTANADTVFPPINFGILRVSTPPHITSLTVSPSTFDPKKENTAISFTLDKTAIVDIKITYGNIPVKTILEGNTLSDTKHTYYWDGRNTAGSFMSEETYTVSVKASNVYGSNTATANVTVKYQSSLTAPHITNLTVTPSVFDPKKGKATISFYLDKDATVYLVVLKDGKAVNNILTGNSVLTPGNRVFYWEGKDNNGAYVNAGSYTVTASASNSAGWALTASTNVTVQYSTPALNITNHYASPSMFDPKTQSTTVYYSLNKAAYVTVRIKQGTNTVKYLKTNVYESHGSAVWDGRYSSGPIAAEGTYTYEVFATVSGEQTQAAGNIIVQYSTLFTAPQITNLTVSPSTFDPNKENASIRFTVDKTATTDIKIMQGSTVIKTVIQGATLSPATHVYYWNGKNTAGSFVAEGTYTANVSVSNNYGGNTATTNVTVKYAQTLTVPNITNLTVTPSTFDPKKEKTDISFYLDKNAIVYLVVLKDGKAVKNILTGSSTLTPGNRVFSWDGKDNSGVYVNAGSYTVTASASNSAGWSPTASTSVTVQYAAPALNITNHYVSNSGVCKPNDTDVGVYYSLNKSAYITVKVTQNSSLVKYLKVNSYEQSGSALWDCKYTNGAFASEGTYKYEISATVGSEAVQAAGNIIVQYTTTPPSALQMANYYVSPATFNPYNENTAIYYSLNKPAYTSISIKQSSDALIKTIKSSTYASSDSAVWDGRNIYGNIVADGTYLYEIYSYIGSENLKVTGYVTVDTTGYPPYYGNKPDVTYASANPDPFNPYFSTTQLSYTLQVSSANISVEVYDKYNYNNKHIVTLLSGVSKNVGTYYVNWNGKDYAGSIVPEGIYTFKVTASNSYGTSIREANVSVDYHATCQDEYYCPSYYSKPYIFNDYASPNPFKVGGGNDTKVYFTLNTSAKVTVTILKENSVIRTLQTSTYTYPGGINYVKWDGRDYNGNYVSVGTYMYKIYAENSYGTDVKTDYIYITAKVGAMVPCGGFSDVNISSPYCKAILQMIKLGIFEGYGDGTFGAEMPINRAETVKVILKTLNKPIDVNEGINFWDVNQNAWYANYVYTAKIMGVIQGYPDGSFRPSQTVNRVELLKIFLKANGTYLPSCSYAPYADTPAGAWYLTYVCYSKKYTLVDAPNSYFNPDKPMKRGDVAELFYRYQVQGLFNKVTNPQN